MNALLTFAASLPASGIPDGPAAPPGVENISLIVSWVLWGAGILLFVFFVYGIVSAANEKKRGGEVDVSAPVWPLVLAIVLGAAGTIWNAVSS